MTYLGIDVGGTGLRAITSDHSGRSTVVERPTPDNYEELVDTIADLAGGPITRAVIGLPGATTADRVLWVPALRFLDNRPLAADLSAKLGGEVLLANDAQLALLGEATEGAAAGMSDVVLVSVGTGVGGAILSGGQIVRGHHGTAGSFGWLPSAGAVSTEDHGALELAASGRALDRLASELGLGSGRDLMAADDKRARDAVRRWASALGEGIAALAAILDPELIIVSGGLSAALDSFADHVSAAIKEKASPLTRDTPVRAAGLGVHAGTIGALRAAEEGAGVWR